MGILTRFKDIINSNLNSILDQAEDPEKMIRLMIEEMEETLIDIKTTCANVIAHSKRIERNLKNAYAKEEYWHEKAQAAVEQGKDNLAREALKEKIIFKEKTELLEQELTELDDMVSQYKEDIIRVESKLRQAMDKQRKLYKKKQDAELKVEEQRDFYCVNINDTVFRIEEMENRIDRMEAEAELVNIDPESELESKFQALKTDNVIEEELEALKTGKPVPDKAGAQPPEMY